MSIVIRGLGYYRNGAVEMSRDDLMAHGGADTGLSENLSKLLAQARTDPDPTAFIWLGLYQPTEDEMKDVADVLNLPTLQVEDAMNVRQRAKTDIRDQTAFVVFKVLRYIEETSDVETGQIAIFLGDHFAVTVRFGAIGELTEARARLESSPEILREGPISALYVVLDSVVDGYQYVADEFETDIDTVQDAVFSPQRGDESQRIYRLKREVMEMRRAVNPLVPSAHAIAQGDVHGIPGALLPYFRDISDHILRVNDQSEGFDALLTALLTANTARRDLQQNSDMRKISGWVAIAAVPTMIAGVYGMNFDNMPELHWQYSYYVVLGVMITACSLMYRAFKRSGWL